MIHDELIARLAAATKGSEELDVCVWAAIVGGEAVQSPINARWCVYRGVDHRGNPRLWDIMGRPEELVWHQLYREGSGPTTSLDAALTLVPEGMAADVHIGPRAIYNQATIWLPIKGKDEQGRRTTSYEPLIAGCAREGTLYQNSPALAVCIAVLKARLVAG